MLRQVVKSLYDLGEDILESYVKINGVNFLVIGVFKNSNSNGDDEEDANTIFVPFTTFSQVFNYGDLVSWMAITAEDQTSITNLKPKIFSLIKKQHTIHPNDNRAIGDYDLAQQFNKISGLFSILTFNERKYFLSLKSNIRFIQMTTVQLEIMI